MEKTLLQLLLLRCCKIWGGDRNLNGDSLLKLLPWISYNFLFFENMIIFKLEIMNNMEDSETQNVNTTCSTQVLTAYI